MPGSLEWTWRARQDVAAIEAYYALIASPRVAETARNSIVAAAMKLCVLPAEFRAGKGLTREYVMRQFPYVLIYRSSERDVRVIRVLHQARRYFSR